MKYYFEVHFDNNFNYTYKNIEEVGEGSRYGVNNQGWWIVDKSTLPSEPDVLEICIDIDVYQPNKLHSEIYKIMDNFVKIFLRKEKLTKIINGF